MTRSELLERAKPILFNTEMVRAIQDGRKTATRRVIKSVPETAHMFLGIKSATQKAEFLCGEIRNGVCFDWEADVRLPFQIGDVLYVRETYCAFDTDHIIDGVKYAYKADSTSESESVRKKLGYKWKPSIHMPKEAARIFLRVTDVRVERLQDCGNMQAKDEGCNCCSRFVRIWDSTIKKSDLAKYGRAANPWVWVIEFERVEVTE